MRNGESLGHDVLEQLKPPLVFGKDNMPVIMERFRNYDRNADGDPAITRLAYLPFEEKSGIETGLATKIVLVLVESRLFKPLVGVEELLNRLAQFKSDLTMEGFESRFISADLYQGRRHQDGRTLLAIREFLRTVRAAYDERFVGVVFVGAFPEGCLVRRWFRRLSDITTVGGVSNEIPHPSKPGETTGSPYLWIAPQFIARRADIVLADLSGHWDRLYHEGPVRFEQIRALPDEATSNTIWPADGAVFSSEHFDKRPIQPELLNDIFFLDDLDYCEVPTIDGVLRLKISHKPHNDEVGPLDVGNTNPISRPDILVSRINARNVAINPDPTIVGDDGKKPLDANGCSQSFFSTEMYSLDSTSLVQDPILERRLLCDYFDRNHAFRTGAFADLPFRCGAIASGEFSASHGARKLSPASANFQSPLVQESANILDYVRWFRQPAVLRYITAHSNIYGTLFDGIQDTTKLEAELGGRPFRWEKQDDEYVLSLRYQGGSADFYIHRTAWQNAVLQGSGASLIIHTGCDVGSPGGTNLYPYYEEGYSEVQPAEELLFYMNGIAVCARAKDMNDEPEGFADALGRNPEARFGNGWQEYFERDAKVKYQFLDGGLLIAKKSYWWSVYGDWTVHLRY